MILNPAVPRCSHKTIEWADYEKNKVIGDGSLPPDSHCEECDESIKLKSSRPAPFPRCTCGEEMHKRTDGHWVCLEKSCPNFVEREQGQVVC